MHVPALIAIIAMFLVLASIAVDLFSPRFHAWVRMEVGGQTRGQWIIAVMGSVVMVCIFLAAL